jgi:glycosyltransferase involved in cell wall biosynthesis
MRLLLVTRGYPPRIGGVETLCRQLAEGLARRGEDVTVVTYGGRAGGVERRGDEASYRVIRLPSRGDTFEWSWRIVPVLRRLRFDVCHVHNLHATVAGAVWASGRRPYVLTAHYHGGGHTRAARLLHPGYRRLAHRVVAGAAVLTAVSRSEAALLRRDFGAEPEIIPNGVDPAAVGRSGPPAGPPTIAVVSRLVGYKRVDAAVRTLAELPDYRLHVVGDGPQRAALLGLADRLGVRDRVRLTCHRLSDGEVRTTLREAAVHVNLSEAEAFSYTVLEALAAGTPVVTNGGAALAEWATRFPGAVLTADPAQPAQVAAAVRRLARGRVDVDLGEYALPVILDRYQQLYATAAGR